ALSACAAARAAPAGRLRRWPILNREVLMNSTDVQTLKRLRPIAEVVESYGIPLRRIGRSLIGRCPFHNDGGRPNLNVYPQTASFYCFRCGMGGDVITFVRQIDGLSFPEAL